MGAKKDRGQILYGIVHRPSGAVLYMHALYRGDYTKESAIMLVPFFVMIQYPAGHWCRSWMYVMDAG